MKGKVNELIRSVEKSAGIDAEKEKKEKQMFLKVNLLERRKFSFS